MRNLVQGPVDTEGFARRSFPTNLYFFVLFSFSCFVGNFPGLGFPLPVPLSRPNKRPYKEIPERVLGQAGRDLELPPPVYLLVTDLAVSSQRDVFVLRVRLL